MRADRAYDCQRPGRIFQQDNRHGDTPPRRAHVNGHTERPHTDGIPHPFARNHRIAHQCAHGIGRRSHNGAPVPAIRAVEGRHRTPHQRFAHCHGIRHCLRLRHRQAAGPRALLHLPAGRSLCRTSCRRKCQGQRHCGKRHQIEKTHKYARVGSRRQGKDNPACRFQP